MSATTLTPEQANPWEVTARTIVYSAIGAALYAVAAQFSFIMPGTSSVSLRPAFALVTFFGFAFGPIPGFFTGLVGNAIDDQLSGWGLLTSWNWSIANGVVGFLTGLLAIWLARSIPNRAVLAGVASVIAIVIGFVIVLSDVWLGTAENFGAAFTTGYFPAVWTDALVAVILTPILVLAWDPIRDAMGR